MSIHAIGAVSPQAAFAPLSSPARPESAEVPGAPDHDGDSDDGSKAASSSRVNVYA
jgi:hypothetical protein